VTKQVWSTELINQNFKQNFKQSFKQN